MSNKRFLRSVRLLAQCYQSFERLSGRHLRELGLTPAQFDIVATLGNLEGLNFRELGLVERFPNPQDGRSEMLRLTTAGNDLFARVFPAHVAHCQQAFRNWSGGDFDDLDARLTRLRDALSAPDLASAGPHSSPQD